MNRLPNEILDRILAESTNPAARDVNRRFRESVDDTCKHILNDERLCRFVDPMCIWVCNQTISYRVHRLSLRKVINGMIFIPTVTVVSDNASLTITPSNNANDRGVDSHLVCTMTLEIEKVVKRFVSKYKRGAFGLYYATDHHTRFTPYMLQITHKLEDVIIDLMYEIMAVMINPIIYRVNVVLHQSGVPIVNGMLLPSSVEPIFQSMDHLTKYAPKGLVFKDISVGFTVDNWYIKLDIKQGGIHIYIHCMLTTKSYNYLLDKSMLDDIESLMYELSKISTIPGKQLEFYDFMCRYIYPREHPSDIGVDDWSIVHWTESPPYKSNTPEILVTSNDVVANFKAKWY